MTQRLFRSSREKMIGGVCGGLAEYFRVDVTLVRIIAIVTLFMGGAGIPLYIAALVIIPSDREKHPIAYGGQGDHGKNPTQRSKTAGLILIALGALFLLDQWFPAWLTLSKMWPLALIVIGAALIWRKS